MIMNVTHIAFIFAAMQPIMTVFPKVLSLQVGKIVLWKKYVFIYVQVNDSLYLKEILTLIYYVKERLSVDVNITVS